jgi:PKD repeat protein
MESASRGGGGTADADTKMESASRGGGGTADADTIRESDKYGSSDTTTTETGEVVSHTYSNSGTYTVSLTVTDDGGRTDTTTETVTVSPSGEAEAAVQSSDVTVGRSFETGESSITIDAEDGVSVANIEVSVDASVAEISNVEPGTDVDENSPSVAFSVEDQGSGSVRIEYSNIQATDSSVTDFELATVELESQTDDGEADIGVTPDRVFSANQNEYIPVDVEEGTLTVGTLFGSPLPGFENPPTNTGEIDPTLYEDVDGDGDGLNPVQSVNLWSQLITSPEEFDDLNQEQVDALDWNGDGELTPTDAVTLWSEQIQAGS